MIALAFAAVLATAAPDLRLAQAPAPIEADIKNGKVEGQRTLRVKRGDDVTLRIASDRKIALHLHGYDIERTAEPGSPAIFSFNAKATGRFSIEEHIPVSGPDAGKKSPGHAPAILYLEVLPK
jgi:hypothetical protein